MHRLAIALAASLALSTPAKAEVVESTQWGFATSHTAVVARDRAEVWNELVHPERWWSHTWSNNSANLRLDAHAGGCFCETIPAADGYPAGSVEHMRVITVMPGKLLRLSGSLGPLQSEGLAGTLSVTLSEVEGGTAIKWDYITAGHAHFEQGDWAHVVNGVQGEFLDGLTARLGGAVTE